MENEATKIQDKQLVLFSGGEAVEDLIYEFLKDRSPLTERAYYAPSAQSNYAPSAQAQPTAPQAPAQSSHSAHSSQWPAMPQPGAYAPQAPPYATAPSAAVDHAQPQYAPQAPPEYAQPIQPSPSNQSFASDEEGPTLNLNGSPTPQGEGEKPLPRDILLQKVRQYRESQARRAGATQPEQLSMDVEGPESSLEAARRLASEIVRSPFDPKNLDVPTFLRRKTREEESENPSI